MYSPQSLSTSKKGPTYRFLAIREPFELDGAERKKLGLPQDILPPRQLVFPEMIESIEEENERLRKLHLTEMGGCVYKVFDIVTNLEDMEGDAIIRWQRKRFWAPHPQQDGGVQRQGGR